ncbi:MAG: lysophospholipid acyltransferase family protein [Balneola sp.]
MQRFVLRFLYSFLCRWFLKLIVGVKFINTEVLKDVPQFIILANHNSHLDTITLLASIPSSLIHKVKPVAAGDYFGKTRLSNWLSSYFINALLIDRKNVRSNPEEAPIPKMISELEKGNSIILFPEGTRGKPEELQPFKRGIGLVLAEKPETPYIPAFLSGMGKNLPKGNTIIVPFTSSLKFGKPTFVSSRDSKEIIKQIEDDIKELKLF